MINLQKLCLASVFLLTLIHSDEFEFEPPQNFIISPKYIAVHHPVRTDNDLAQLYFDQGLTFLYAFNHEAAYWSFIRASEIDPKMAMAYWGQALVLGANINIEIVSKRAKVAYKTIQKAVELLDNANENEKAYINALKERYSEDPNADWLGLAMQYSKAMSALKDQYKDDPDASVLFAESLLNLRPWSQWDKGKPQEGTLQAMNVLENVLIRYPMHLGANHYYIHVIEASSEPWKGLISAERLKKLLPSSGHIMHMPAHIYLLVGDYEQAAAVNETAIAADREYIREFGLSGTYPVHYLSHNLHFLSQAYSMQGRYQNAKQAAIELNKLYLPHFSKMPELEQYASTLMFVYLRFHKWKELLELPIPSDNALITTTLLHFGRSIAFSSFGNTQQAANEQEQFLKGKSQIQAGAKYGFNKASSIMKLAEYFLDATLAEAKGQYNYAIESYNKAIKEQDSLSYDEPPNWLFSVRDSLGALFIKEKKYKEAEEVFREDLRQHPRNGRSLFGLKISLEAQSKMVDYYWVDKSFQEAWRYSDVELNLDNL